MEVRFGPTPPAMGDHALLARDTGVPYVYLLDCLKDDPRLRGRVLDIGCGEWPTILLLEELFPLYQLAGDLDGIDPFPAAKNHPWLTNAWVGEFGAASPCPPEAYDCAFAINVVEHVSDPAPFFAGVMRVLRPGGVFIATTPSSTHPFAWCVRAIENLKLKRAASGDGEHANAYPAYYRANSVAAVTRYAREAGFSRVTFFNHPAVNWRQYMPGPTKAVGWLYDALLGVRFRSCAQQCMFMLEKPGVGAGALDQRKSRVRRVPPQRRLHEVPTDQATVAST
jgi:SAM-dependent methyltransferase